MKKLLFTLSLLFSFLLNCYSQVLMNNDSNSLVVKFSLREGTLIQKEYYNIGNLKRGITCNAIVLTDKKTNEKTGGLQIKTIYQSSVYGNADYIGTIDYDEIDHCLHYLRLVQDSLIKFSAFVNTEYNFNTRGGTIIQIFYSNQKGWSAHIQTKRDNYDSVKQIDMKDFSLFIQFLNDAKVIIEEQISQEAINFDF